MAIISIPPSTLKLIQKCMQDIQSPAVFGTKCEIFYPPIELPIQHYSPDPIGKKPSNMYVDGGSVPISTEQVSVYSEGSANLATESSEIIYMTVDWMPSQYDPTFPKGFRYANGNILTRGSTSDMQKVMNSNFMEIHENTGFAHYRFKLIGEPVLASQFFEGVFFWAWWDRA